MTYGAVLSNDFTFALALLPSFLLVAAYVDVSAWYWTKTVAVSGPHIRMRKYWVRPDRGLNVTTIRVDIC
jgi:hypothetical protein